MSSEKLLERYLSAQMKVKSRHLDKESSLRPFLTLSRQAGAGAITIGKKIVDILNQKPHDIPWTLFDKELVNVVLEKHNLPQDLSKYMVEDAVNSLANFIDDLFGIHPPSHLLVRRTNETIAALAQMGNAVLVGRGANFLTRKMKGGFHVRLVAAKGKRVQHLQEYYGLSKKDAAERLKSTDEGRRNYVRDVFGQDIRDTMAYDCVVNTTWLSNDSAAEIIAAKLLKEIK